MNIKKIAKLIKLLEESTISEIEVKGVFNNIILRKTPGYLTQKENISRGITPVSTEVIEVHKETGIENIPVKEVTVEKPANLQQVTAPMVGTFYRAPSPTSDPYVNDGDRVTKGQVLCIIEAMKLMNEIESPYSGLVKIIHIENAEPVEYGTVLFTIEV